MVGLFLMFFIELYIFCLVVNFLVSDPLMLLLELMDLIDFKLLLFSIYWMSLLDLQIIYFVDYLFL